MPQDAKNDYIYAFKLCNYPNSYNLLLNLFDLCNHSNIVNHHMINLVALADNIIKLEVLLTLRSDTDQSTHLRSIFMS